MNGKEAGCLYEVELVLVLGPRQAIAEFWVSF